MKRLFSGLLCAVLALMCVAASADDLNVTLGDAFSLTRPAALEVIDLTEDDEAENMVYAATNDELEMYIWAYDQEGMDNEELYDQYREDEWLSDAKIETIGGVEMITYSIDEEGIGATIPVSGDKYYEIMFYCLTADATAMAQNIIKSIVKA